jgi:VWFA-related protein
VKIGTSLALVVLLAAAPLATRHEDPPERVRISTFVTDRAGKPVTGLALKDFELREDGVVQKLVAVEARTPAPRRMAIVLDEFHVEADDSARVREAVTTFVDEHVRPDDSLVVVKPLDPLTKINLTPDRQRARDAIAAFQGRKGNYTPRNALEQQTMGTAPALVEAGRAQVVLSALRALATQLGATSGRSAIFLVSEGFSQRPRRGPMRGLPDAAVVERFANRYDVPIYAFDPRVALPDSDADVPAVILGRLVSETGGTFSRGDDLAASLARAAREIDGGYTLTYEPSHGGDGKYHPVAVTVVRREADARSRTGYVSPPSAAMRRAMRDLVGSGPVLSTRLLRRSPLIDVWSGVTRVSGGNGRVMVTWEPGRGFTSAARSAASRVQVKATTKDGRVLFEGMLAPVRVGEATDAAMPDRAEFDAPPGRVQLDMTILGVQGQKLDVDARDLDVPALKGNAAVLLPPILIATQSAREFREVSADASAAPDPSRQFRRTERLVIRVPAYAGGAPLPVTARLLNRLAQPMRTIDAVPGDAGVTQFDLPLAPLAPGEYFLLFTVKGPSGPVDQRVSFKITG